MIYRVVYVCRLTTPRTCDQDLIHGPLELQLDELDEHIWGCVSLNEDTLLPALPVLAVGAQAAGVLEPDQLGGGAADGAHVEPTEIYVYRIGTN